MTEQRIGTTASGRVTAFDAYVGLGEITSDAGHVVPFHCVELADGSRTIDLGVAVDFRLAPKLGRYEAFDIHPARG